MGVDFRSLLIGLPTRAKSVIVAAADSALICGSLGISIVATYPSHPVAWPSFTLFCAVLVAVAIPILASQGLYRSMMRFVGQEMIFAVFRSASVLAAGVALFHLYYIESVQSSIALGVLFWAFSVLGLAASRLAMRAVLASRGLSGEKVVIYGAGQAGCRLAAAMVAGREYRAELFVDDSPSLQGRLIAGLPVHDPARLPELVKSHGIRRVLLALPSATRRKRQEIITRLAEQPVRVQTVPDIDDLLSGRARVDDVRDVEVADLLGREVVPPNVELLGASIFCKSVMVTGAGGSIGSELCRQIIRLRPTRLVLVELSESALFEIDLELRRTILQQGVDLELVPILASVHHRDRIARVMDAFRVQTVYHAAAFKHVPLVEYNMNEGVFNNIIGTWHTAEAACLARVETFVLISTDKAVSPVNVMGASKRFAELVLQAMSERQSSTRFCMVRFGNVLDSSGSVVPVFREQIRRGGPVTVTHREIIRYFMTIPEAAQLVLQAGSMSQGGDVFVLDMGKPVRIADLARRMIHLMGLTVRDHDNPDGDIAIEFTGLRPAEKLYEELLIGTNVTGTDHPMIMRAVEEYLPWTRVQQFLDQFYQSAARGDCEQVRDLLVAAVAGYRPANGIDDLVWQSTTQPQVAESKPQAPSRTASVTDLASRRAAGPPAN